MKMIKKGIVIIIIVLFVGASITTSIGINVKKDFSTEKNKFYIVRASYRNDWWDKNWTYRKEITINHDKVTSDLQHFPVLISVVSSDFIEHVQIDGDDFVFVSEDNSNIYNHEIEYYESSSGKLVTWVNIPSLSSSFDTILYIYYGNSNCSSQQNIDGVWDSNYIHVWHMGDNLNDSAGSDDGTNYGTDIVTGKIGKGRDFESDKYDFIDFGDMAQPADGSLNVGTLELWVNIDDVNENCHLMLKYATGGTARVSYISSILLGGKPRFYVYKEEGANWFYFTANNQEISSNNWQYIAFGITIGSIRNIDIYVDGLEVPSTKFYEGSQPSVFRDIPKVDEIGRYRPEAGTYYYDYKIDEMRWSKVVRSDAWINTSYNSMNDPSSFFSIGAEEPSNFPPSKPSNPYPMDGTMDVPIDTNLSWVCSDPEGGNVTFDIYFGSSNPPPKVVENCSDPDYDPGLLDYCTTYYWQIVAWDDYGQSTTGDIWQFKTVCNGPPDVPRIMGPTSGKPGVTYSYSFVSEDPNDDDVFYEIDWGDGQVDPWDGPHKSNDVISMSHSWDYEGTFIISARAMDIYENIGDWGELEITIPRDKLLTNPFILHLLERFPFLERLYSLFSV